MHEQAIALRALCNQQLVRHSLLVRGPMVRYEGLGVDIEGTATASNRVLVSSFARLSGVVEALWDEH